MKYAVLFGLWLGIGLCSWAGDRKLTQGEYEIHYSAFNGDFLSAEMAQSHNLIRSNQQGVVSIALFKAGLPKPALITGTLTFARGQELPLGFRQIKEGNSLYYLSQFPIAKQDVLTFNLLVQPLDSDPIPLTFTQEVFPEP